MARSRHGPAAGASGGRDVYRSEIWMPEWIRFDHAELIAVANLRNPIAWHVYLYVVAYSDFATGEFLGKYQILQSYLTPDAPQRGPRGKGPTMWALRKAVDQMIDAHILRRGSTNEEQGQLRLFCHPRDEEANKKRRAAKAAREALRPGKKS